MMGRVVGRWAIEIMDVAEASDRLGQRGSHSTPADNTHRVATFSSPGRAAIFVAGALSGRNEGKFPGFGGAEVHSGWGAELAAKDERSGNRD